MSQLLLELKKINNNPNLIVNVKKEKKIRETITKNQVKNSLNDIFLESLKNDKDNISFFHGLEVERNLVLKNYTYNNSFIVELNEDNEDNLSFNLVDDNNIVKYRIPTIANLSNNQDYSVSYTVRYFSFPTNIINYSDIKLEESLIFTHYNRYKQNLSSGRLKRIIKQIKENKKFQNIDPLFYKIYELNAGSTKQISQTLNTRNNVNIVTKLIYNKKNLMLEVDNTSNFILTYDIDIEKIKILDVKDNITYAIKEIVFNRKQAKYFSARNNLYFNIFNSLTYESYVNKYKNLKIQINLRVYNRSNNNIIKIKSETFDL